MRSIPPGRAASIAVGLGIFAYNLQRMTVITGSWSLPRLASAQDPEPAPVVLLPTTTTTFFRGK